MIGIDGTQLTEVLRRAEQSLDEHDFVLVRAVFESYTYVSDLVEDKNTSISRLRDLLFGSRTEKTDAVTGQKTKKSEAVFPRDIVAKAGSSADGENGEELDSAASKGHGRNSAEAYRGASWTDVPRPSLAAGDACHACDQGTVYEKAPGVLVRITGQTPLAANIYQLQKLRCHLCGQVFTATALEPAGDQRYDATAGSMIGLLK